MEGGGTGLDFLVVDGIGRDVVTISGVVVGTLTAVVVLKVGETEV